MNTQHEEDRMDWLDMAIRYLVRHGADKFPPCPPGINRTVYAIIGRIYYLLKDIDVSSRKVIIYVGDLGVTMNTVPYYYSQALELIQTWKNVPCIYCRLTYESWKHYQISFSDSYDSRIRTLTDNSKAVVRKYTRRNQAELF
jgi:hypothetical protein